MAADTTREHPRRPATIGEFIREQRELAQVSLRQLARLAGVSNPYLSQVERGLRRPSAEILAQIATGLRISAEQLYIRAGILQARAGKPELVSAILADADLLERQKQILIEIYDSFCRENAASGSGSAAHPARSGAPSGTASDAPAPPATPHGPPPLSATG